MSNAAKQTLSMGGVAALLASVLAAALYVGTVAVSIDHRLTTIEDRLEQVRVKVDEHIAKK